MLGLYVAQAPLHIFQSRRYLSREGGVFLIKGREGKAALTLSDSSSFI